jgi:hypothetical protein
MYSACPSQPDWILFDIIWNFYLYQVFIFTIFTRYLINFSTSGFNAIAHASYPFSIK